MIVPDHVTSSQTAASAAAMAESAIRRTVDASREAIAKLAVHVEDGTPVPDCVFRDIVNVTGFAIAAHGTAARAHNLALESYRQGVMSCL